MKDNIKIKSFKVCIKPKTKRTNIDKYKYYDNNVIIDDNTNTSKTNYESELLKELDFLYKSSRNKVILRTFKILLIFYVPFFFYTICTYDYTNFTFIFIVSICFFISLFFLFILSLEDEYKKINITYDFKGRNNIFTDKITPAFEDITKCYKKWQYNSTEHLQNAYQSKINAGAKELIDMDSIFIGFREMPFVKTNISIPAIITKNNKYYFMPDYIYVYSKNEVKRISYSNIEINNGEISMIYDNPPPDSKIIEYRWQYLNKDGSPDARFKDNKQIPICVFGELEIRVNNEQILLIITSTKEAAFKFKKLLQI